MCYSAQVSFLASGFLAIMGILSVMKTKERSAVCFAAMPLLFAVQQGSEGLLWLSYTSNLELAWLMPYIFLFFAFFLWPIYIPLSVTLIEPLKSRRCILWLLTVAGTGVACYLYGYILFYGVSGHPLNCHIYYSVNIPAAGTIFGTLAYLTTTVLPFLLSSVIYLPIFGMLLLLSYVISFYYYYTHLISVWCFFAALLSSLVYTVVSQDKKP